MITSIMQPTFLPSPIYLSLIYQSDNFVFLDNVQFSKQSWQQRNKIITKKSAAWITVPIKKSKFNNINEIKIIKNDRNFKKILNLIKLSYSKSIYFEKYYNQFEKILLNHQEKLCDLNINLIKWLCDCFNIKSNFSNITMSDIDSIIEKCIDDIWKTYDKDNSGFLDKGETKQFVKNTLSEMGESGEFSEADFEACFKEFDKDGNGTISKDEMKIFIKKVAGL